MPKKIFTDEQEEFLRELARERAPFKVVEDRWLARWPAPHTEGADPATGIQRLKNAYYKRVAAEGEKSEGAARLGDAMDTLLAHGSASATVQTSSPTAAVDREVAPEALRAAPPPRFVPREGAGPLREQYLAHLAAGGARDPADQELRLLGVPTEVRQELLDLVLRDMSELSDSSIQQALLALEEALAAPKRTLTLYGLLVAEHGRRLSGVVLPADLAPAETLDAATSAVGAMAAAVEALATTSRDLCDAVRPALSGFSAQLLQHVGALVSALTASAQADEAARAREAGAYQAAQDALQGQVEALRGELATQGRYLAHLERELEAQAGTAPAPRRSLRPGRQPPDDAGRF